jgi:bifunctional non-homologous end joining protein LigD
LRPFAPDLCKPQKTVPDGDGWLHETKWDGYRMVAVIDSGVVRIWSRNANECTGRVSELVNAVESLGLRDAHLDGEMVLVREGRSDFNRLQDRLAAGKGDPRAFALFDLPRLDGLSLRDLPLLERKERLRARLERAAHPALI